MDEAKIKSFLFGVALIIFIAGLCMGARELIWWGCVAVPVTGRMAWLCWKGDWRAAL